MNESPESASTLCLVVGGACAASAVAWLAIAVRRRRGRPVLPCEPRRPVPWGAIDALIVFIVYLVALSATGRLVGVFVTPEFAAEDHAGETTSAHLIALLVSRGGPGSLLLAAVSVVVVAPIVEELVFRLALQGWLEAAERRLAHSLRPLRPLVPWPAGSILLASLLFGAMHVRGPAPIPSHEYLVGLVIGSIVAGLLTIALSLVLLRLRGGATAADLGWVPQKLLPDLKVGVVGFLAVVGPVYLTQVAAMLVVGKGAADPFALLVFAAGLGTLYFRTHRIVPAIVAHASLNALTLAMLAVSALVER